MPLRAPQESTHETSSKATATVLHGPAVLSMLGIQEGDSQSRARGAAMSRYTCYACKDEHGTDNMVAYCAACYHKGSEGKAAMIRYICQECHSEFGIENMALICVDCFNCLKHEFRAMRDSWDDLRKKLEEVEKHGPA